jgi:gamma-glutamylcyclotransferase (GGCT)/AIG2-like uncharacterized protein YtfP
VASHKRPKVRAALIAGTSTIKGHMWDITESTINHTDVMHLTRELHRQMVENRDKYGKHWRVLRIDRIANGFYPFLSDEQVQAVVKIGVQWEDFRLTTKTVDGKDIPAIELVNY